MEKKYNLKKSSEINGYCFDISNMPILKASEAFKMLFDIVDNDYLPCEDYYVKPVYSLLPNTDGLSQSEIAEYIFKDFEEDFYLIGLEVIGAKYLSPSFTSMMFDDFGLILRQSEPMYTSGDKWSIPENYTKYLFTHILSVRKHI